jgi:hypothetical protein
MPQAHLATWPMLIPSYTVAALGNRPMNNAANSFTKLHLHSQSSAALFLLLRFEHVRKLLVGCRERASLQRGTLIAPCQLTTEPKK